VAVWRGKPLLTRNPAEMNRQVTYAPGHAEALLARGVHTAMAVPLIAGYPLEKAAAANRTGKRWNHVLTQLTEPVSA